MLRVSGLASGIDTESIIKQMMEAHRIPQTKLVQQKQILEWQRDDYRTVNSKILEFRNLMFDMKLTTSYNAKSALVSDDSAIEVSAGGNAPVGLFRVKVNQLAEGASLVSNQQLGAGDSSKTLGELAGGFTGTTTLKVEGAKGSVDITVDSSQSIEKLVSDINAKSSETGVSASYDAGLDRFFFTSVGTGEETSVRLEAEDASLLTAIGMTTEHEFSESATIFQAHGKNAIVEFNGIEGSFATNNFTINGITINAKAVQTTEVNITVTQDTDAVFDKIKSFVDKYNEMIDLINGELGEKRNRDFQPLTDEQKKEMTEKEIELWEEKARSGMLRGDYMLSSALDSFRRALSTNVDGLPEGALKHLAEIGITTGTWLEKGKLHINEDKLRDAIANRPDEVSALFRAEGSNNAGNGLAVRLYDEADAVIKSLTEKAGREGSANTAFQLGKRIDDIDDRLSDMERKLMDLETRYYHQFTAMEKYINQMNSQSMWLAQQFGGM